MNEINIQKNIAKDILNKLQKIDMFAMLAGGACRDWVLGKEANDLDFYIHYSDKYPQWVLCEFFSKILESDVRVIGKKGEQQNPESQVVYTQDPNIDIVLGCVVGGIDVQLIIVNTPYFNVGNFCFDICQAYSTNIDIVQTTRAFDEAVRHKVIRITGEFYSQKDAYIKKIKEKFPDYLHIGF